MPRPGGDNISAVFSGTLIVKGYGTAVVTFTGSRTEIRKLGLALRGISLEDTNLERETRSLVRFFAIQILGSKVTMMGRTVVIAREVKKGDDTLKLRDERGVPLWPGMHHRAT
jgi:magnesium-transporting ATPase (P-type)